MNIRNWKRFQVYSKRNPPWIRLYRDLLDKPEWFDLDPKAAKILVGLWLLASESDDGTLPDDCKTLAFRLRVASTEIEEAVKQLTALRIIENASTMLAPCLQPATPDQSQRQIRVRSERETEAEREGEDMSFFESFWKIYPRRKNVSKSKAAETWKKQNLDSLSKEIEKAVIQLVTSDWLEIDEKFIPHPATWLNQRRWETAGETKIETGIVHRASARYERIFGNE